MTPAFTGTRGVEARVFHLHPEANIGEGAVPSVDSPEETEIRRTGIEEDTPASQPQGEPEVMLDSKVH